MRPDDCECLPGGRGRNIARVVLFKVTVSGEAKVLHNFAASASPRNQRHRRQWQDS